MNALALLKGLVTLVQSIAQYMHDKRLVELGAAESVLKGLNEVNEAIDRARNARNAPSLSDDQDPNNRRNK